MDEGERKTLRSAYDSLNLNHKFATHPCEGRRWHMAARRERRNRCSRAGHPISSAAKHTGLSLSADRSARAERPHSAASTGTTASARGACASRPWSRSGLELPSLSCAAPAYRLRRVTRQTASRPRRGRAWASRSSLKRRGGQGRHSAPGTAACTGVEQPSRPSMAAWQGCGRWLSAAAMAMASDRPTSSEGRPSGAEHQHRCACNAIAGEVRVADARFDLAPFAPPYALNRLASVRNRELRRDVSHQLALARARGACRPI